MIVAVIYFEMHIPHAQSLKEKRSAVNSLKKKIRNKFNVSVAEVDFLDKWQRSAFGVSIVETKISNIDIIASKLESFVSSDHRIQLTRWDIRLN